MRLWTIALIPLSVILLFAQQKPSPETKASKNETKMWVTQVSGEQVELAAEEAAVDTEHIGPSQTATPQNTASLVRLAGGKATVRFPEGEPVEVYAKMPAGSHPRQLDLFRFESRGKQRLTYMQAFGAPTNSPRWNTVSFMARRLADGTWKLQPAKTLPPGEYCFSPQFNNQNFCFGVDKR